MNQEKAATENVPWSESFAHALDEVRAQSQELLEHQRVDLDRIEADLRECLNEVRSQAGDESENSPADEPLRQRIRLIERQATHVLQFKAEILAHQNAWKAMHEAVLTDQAAHAEQLARREQELMELQSAAACPGKGEQEDLSSLQRLQLELDEANQRCEKLSAEISVLREKEETFGQREKTSEEKDELQELRLEREILIDRLVEAESTITQSTNNVEVARQTEELQNRFEVAMEDVRELKRHNAELEEENAQLRSFRQPQQSIPKNTDWENQKQRLLSSLEEDSPGEDEQARATVEGTLRITDQIIAEKDQEIAQLKKCLQQQGATDEESDATSLDSEQPSPDQDEAVRLELDKINRVREEFREKQRQAEIDLAIARAKLAREKSELEEKWQEYQSKAGGTQEEGQSGRPARGRWLSRLGLKDSSD